MKKKIKKYLPYSRQYIDRKDILSVISVLKSNFITQGKSVNNFEKKVTSRVGSKFGVATNSATSALHIACLSLGLSKNDIDELVTALVNIYQSSAEKKPRKVISKTLKRTPVYT